MATRTLSNGNQGQEVLRDYRHAARIFTDNNFRLSPKYGWLFYVEFDFNPNISEISNTAAQEMGMIVKSVSLPKYTIDTKVHNAYNRVNIVQNKIKYDPVNIVFHDDQADNVKQFWYDYYSFFYRDPDYADSTYGTPHKYDRRASFDWGYTPRPTTGFTTYNAIQPYQYIQAIRIYSLYQGNFSEYQLVNPTITSFKHGDLVNGSNETLQSEMSVQFETVKYLEGYVTQNTAGGFVDLHYDNTLSPNGTQPGEQAPNTSPTVVTDLANNQTTMGNPLMRTDYADNSLGSSFATGFNSATLATAGIGVNNGGFSIPSLSGLTTGVTNSAMIGQQLQAAGIGIAGRAVGTIAGSVVNGVAGGLGVNKSVIGLAASAIANPTAALRTVENMAIGYATNLVSGAAQQLATNYGMQLSSTIQTGISGALGDLNSTLGTSIFGEGISFSQGLGSGVNNLIANPLGGLSGTATFLPDGSVDASNLSGW